MTPTNYKLKIVAIICFVFIAISEFIAYANPSKGYELSIYAQTPVSVWVFLIGSIIGGVAILVHQAVTKGHKNNSFWLIGLFIIILAQETLFYLPYIRGYLLFQGADTTEHIAWFTGILSSGHFSNENFYPVTHILLSEIILLTGIQKLTVVMFSGSFILVTYVLSIYMLSTVVSPEMEQRLLMVATIASMPYTFNIYTSAIFPVYWSAILIPFLLFIFFKRSNTPYSILFVVFLIFYPFFHVFSSLIIIIVLAVIELSRPIYMYIINYGTNVIPMSNSKLSLTPIFVESVILITWIFSFHIFYNNLRFIKHQIINGMGADVLGEMGTGLDMINLHGFDFVQLLIQIYGTKILFVVLSLVAAFILIKQIRSGNVKKETQRLFSLLCVFFGVYFIYLLYLLGAPVLSGIAGDRMLYVAPLLSPIFAGFCLYELFKNTRFKHLASICIICVIISASVLSIFSYYNSPYTKSPNNQVTSMDMAGMTWFIEQKNITIGHVYIATPPGKFVITVLGDIEARKRLDVFYTGKHFSDHFDYVKSSSLGELYDENKYAVITKFDRVLYTTVWKEVGRF
ncbi:MAG: hypothetical protein WB014_03370, partial [Methanosarcina sp.]